MTTKLSNRTRLTPQHVKSLLDESKWYGPLHRQMVEGLSDGEACRLEEACLFNDMTLEKAQWLVGLTIAQARNALLGKTTLEEARRIEARRFHRLHA